MARCRSRHQTDICGLSACHPLVESDLPARVCRDARGLSKCRPANIAQSVPRRSDRSGSLRSCAKHLAEIENERAGCDGSAREFIAVLAHVHDGVFHAGAFGSEHDLALALFATRSAPVLFGALRRCACHRPTSADCARALCAAVSSPARVATALASGCNFCVGLFRRLRALVPLAGTLSSTKRRRGWFRVQISQSAYANDSVDESAPDHRVGFAGHSALGFSRSETVLQRATDRARRHPELRIDIYFLFLLLSRSSPCLVLPIFLRRACLFCHRRRRRLQSIVDLSWRAQRANVRPRRRRHVALHSTAVALLASRD